LGPNSARRRWRARGTGYRKVDDIQRQVREITQVRVVRNQRRRKADVVRLNLRLPTHGGLWAWDFERDGRELKVRVEGQIKLNDILDVVQAALAGFGLLPMFLRT